MIAAVGNSQNKNSAITSPSINPKVISVGAVDSTTQKKVNKYKVASFSSRGITIDGFNKPDLVAPGHRIISLASNVSSFNSKKDTYREGTGTSEAAAVVTGISAVLMSHYKNKSVDQIEQMLLDYCITIDDSQIAQGHGFVLLR